MRCSIKIVAQALTILGNRIACTIINTIRRIYLHITRLIIPATTGISKGLGKSGKCNIHWPANKFDIAQRIFEEEGKMRSGNSVMRCGGFLVALLCLVVIALAAPVMGQGVVIINYGDFIQDSISVFGQVDRYRFSGTAGQHVIIRMDPDGVNTNFRGMLELFGPSDSMLLSQYDDYTGWPWGEHGGRQVAFVDYVLPQTGSYTLYVREQDGDMTSGYWLSLQCRETLASHAQPLWCDDYVEASIAPYGDIDAYVFTADSGRKIIIRVDPEGIDTWFQGMLELYSPSDSQLLSNYDNSSGGRQVEFVDYVLPETGTYTLYVREQDGDMTSNYWLSIFDRQCNDIPLIHCPGAPVSRSICALGESARISLPVVGENTVTCIGATWANDTLSFTANNFGTYNFTVIATNANGADTCEVTVNVTQDVPMIIDTRSLTFFTYDTASVLPPSQMIHISSSCPPGSLSWTVTEVIDRDWLAIDKFAGSNPDSLRVSITRTHMAPGVYTTMLMFTNGFTNDSVYVNLSILVESGIDIGDDVVQAGQSTSVPVTFFTTDSLSDFTLPLAFRPTQPGVIKLDSVVTDPNLIDTIIYNFDSSQIVFRPMQPPPHPDSVYHLARIFVTASASATTGILLIDTVTTTIDGQAYSYQFVKKTGGTTVPAFNPGVINIGPPPMDRSLDIASVTCPVGDSVGVPIIATGITNLAGLELTISYDTTKLQVTNQIASSKYFGLTRNALGGSISVAGATNPQHPITVPNGDTLLTLWFIAIGNPGDTGVLHWGISNKLSDPLSDPITNVGYSDGSVVILDGTGRLGGRISYYSNSAHSLPGVSVNLSGVVTANTTTSPDGRYSFPDLTPGNYTVTPVDNRVPKGLDIFDVVKLMRSLVRLDTLLPYQMLSSDVNAPTGDGAVDIADVVAMLRDIARIAPLPSGPWAFVDKTYIANVSNWHSARRSRSLSHTGPSQMNLDFLGLRMGDVKGDYPSPLGALSKVGTSATSKVTLALESIITEGDDGVTVPISIVSDDPVAGIQMQIRYDNDKLQYVGLSSAVMHQYLANERDGIINVAWVDLESQLGTGAADTIIRLNFKSRGVAVDAGSVSLEECLASDSRGNALSVSLFSGLAGNGETGLPGGFALSQNYPNPFNPETRIDFNLPAQGKVRLDVYNIVGQLITTLVDETMKAGPQSIYWRGADADGKQVASGVYLYRLQTGQFVASKKMVLLK